MPTISPFTPQTGSTGGTVSLVASTASTNVALPVGSGNQVRILSFASLPTYVSFGTSTVTTSTSYGMPLAASMTVPEKLTLDTIATGSVGNQLTYMAAIASVATTLPIYVTRGEGF